MSKKLKDPPLPPLKKGGQIQKTIKTFPTEPGCYLMKDERGRIIYIGKAKNLRARVSQYFTKEADTRYQIIFLLKRVCSIDYLVCDSEKEALLLENSLIKKHKPRYNIFLKDDKSYLSLKLNLQHKFPRIQATRHIKKDGSTYFGPYASAEACRETVEFIYRHFKLRSCTDRDFAQRTRPCLEYQIQRCTAPCVNYVTEADYQKQVELVKNLLEGKSSEVQASLNQRMMEVAEKQDFEEAVRLRDLLKYLTKTLEKQKVIKHGGIHQDIVFLYKPSEKGIVAVLNVRGGALMDSRYYFIQGYEEQSEVMSAFLGRYYAKHPFIPDEILVNEPVQNSELIEAVLSEQKGKKVRLRRPLRGEKKDLVLLAEKNARARLNSVWATLDRIALAFQIKQKLQRIECYDVSNLFGSYPTASMTVMVAGELDTSLYRHFSIKAVTGIDDYAMMSEVLQRRFRAGEQASADPSFAEAPDLIVLDGGRGQLSAAMKVCKEFSLHYPIVGMAKGQGRGVRAKGDWKEKKEEEFYLPGRKNPVRFRKGSEELKLLQRIRDEAHRFAITLHRKQKERGDLT